MLRTDVGELHYITSRKNLASIMTYGILSHLLADGIGHWSVASADVQDRRRLKVVPPNGARLHSYVNLYFDARNPMLYKLLRDGHRDLIIIRVSEAVLDIPGAIVTDGNAASDPTRFFPSSNGLAALNRDRIYAEYWTDPDYFTQLEKKRIKNAEVLIPGQVNVAYIQGCYADTTACADACRSIVAWLPVAVNRRIYFG